MKPEIAAQKMIDQLRDPKFGKKAIFDLQKQYLQVRFALTARFLKGSWAPNRRPVSSLTYVNIF
jgi:hypothetical protein